MKSKKYWHGRTESIASTVEMPCTKTHALFRSELLEAEKLEFPRPALVSSRMWINSRPSYEWSTLRRKVDLKRSAKRKKTKTHRMILFNRDYHSSQQAYNQETLEHEDKVRAKRASIISTKRK